MPTEVCGIHAASEAVSRHPCRVSTASPPPPPKPHPPPPPPHHARHRTSAAARSTGCARPLARGPLAPPPSGIVSRATRSLGRAPLGQQLAPRCLDSPASPCCRPARHVRPCLGSGGSPLTLAGGRCGRNRCQCRPDRPLVTLHGDSRTRGQGLSPCNVTAVIRPISGPPGQVTAGIHARGLALQAK